MYELCQTIMYCCFCIVLWTCHVQLMEKAKVRNDNNQGIMLCFCHQVIP
jgi:hypothetical protein